LFLFCCCFVVSVVAIGEGMKWEQKGIFRGLEKTLKVKNFFLKRRHKELAAFNGRYQ
jgi:hypothetical protein